VSAAEAESSASLSLMRRERVTKMREEPRVCLSACMYLVKTCTLHKILARAKLSGLRLPNSSVSLYHLQGDCLKKRGVSSWSRSCSPLNTFLLLDPPLMTSPYLLSNTVFQYSSVSLIMEAPLSLLSSLYNWLTGTMTVGIQPYATNYSQFYGWIA